MIINWIDLFIVGYWVCSFWDWIDFFMCIIVLKFIFLMRDVLIDIENNMNVKGLLFVSYEV